MLVLSEKEIQQSFGMKDALHVIRKAVIDHQQGKITNPERTVVEHPEKEASTLYMPAAIASTETAAVKVVTIFPNNSREGLPTTQGVLLLSSTRNGSHLACMNASYLTRLRTGAISGIATEYLARPDAAVAAVTGCGRMAIEQLDAVLLVRPIENVVLWSNTAQNAVAFREMMKSRFPEYRGAVTLAKTADEAVAQADVVIAATRALSPFFSADSLRPGTHINGVGSYLPHMQEIGSDVLNRCGKIFVDTLAGVKEEAGDFLIPINKGIFSWDRVDGEIGEVAAGRLSGRENPAEISFFKSVGIAYFDLAVAVAVYEKNLQSGGGVEVEL